MRRMRRNSSRPPAFSAREAGNHRKEPFHPGFAPFMKRQDHARRAATRMPMPKRTARFARRTRVFRASSRVWKPRLVFWLGTIAIGVTSVGFAWLADRAQKAFAAVTALEPSFFLLPLVITPLG